MLGHLKLGEAVSDDLDDERLGEAIEAMNRRHGFSDGDTLKPGSRGEALARNAMLRMFGDQLKADDLKDNGRRSLLVRTSGESQSASPRNQQLAQATEQSAEQNHQSAEPRDPVLGAVDKLDYLFRKGGVQIPKEKVGLPGVVDNWVDWSEALKREGVSGDAYYTMMLLFAWEGGLTPDKQNGKTVAVAGLTEWSIRTYGAKLGIPPNTKPEDLTNDQRVALYKEAFNWSHQAFADVGGIEFLNNIGDRRIAATIVDTVVRWGGSTIKDVIQRSINTTLKAHPEIAGALSEERRGSDGPDRPGSSFARIGEDYVLGPDSLRALQAISQSENASCFLLNAMADKRIEDHPSNAKKQLGDEDGDRARYNFFRFGCGK